MRAFILLVLAIGCSWAADAKPDPAREELTRIKKELDDSGTQPGKSVDVAKLRKPLADLSAFIEAQKDPKNDNVLVARLTRYQIYHRQGRMQEAEADLQAVIDSGSHSPYVQGAVSELAAVYASENRADDLDKLAGAASGFGVSPDFIQQMRRISASLRLEVGRPFPDVELVDLRGKRQRIADYRGKLLLLHVWATWSEPSLHELPRLQQAYSALHDRGFEIISVSLDDDHGRLVQVLNERAISWPQCCDEKSWDGAIVSQLGIQTVPELYLIGPDGRLLAKDIHPEQLDLATLIDRLVPIPK
jgi:peroxiredoxin